MKKGWGMGLGWRKGRVGVGVTGGRGVKRR